MHPLSVLEIRPTYKCNNLCMFCREGCARDSVPDMDMAAVVRLLKRNSGKFRCAVFSGGEPTLRDDLPEMLAAARQEGFATAIETNARRAAYRGFAEKLAGAGADRIIVSLNGHCAVLHDYLTQQQGSFAETILGITQLIEAGAKVEVQTVATRSGVYSLAQTAGLVGRLGGKGLSIVFPTVPHEAGFARSIVPLVTLAAKCTMDAAEVARAAGVSVAFSGFPLCVIGHDAVTYSTDMAKCVRVCDSRGMAAVSRATAAGLKKRNCAGCIHFSSCPGPPVEYVKAYSAKEFKPVIKDCSI